MTLSFTINKKKYFHLCIIYIFLKMTIYRMYKHRKLMFVLRHY